MGAVVEIQPCAAETLLDALAGAYQYSPTIDAERARQRARDEDIARANSGYRPDISATSVVGREQTITQTQSGILNAGPEKYHVAAWVLH